MKGFHYDANATFSFNNGLTDTSTRWEAFVGFTYLLLHRLR